MTLSGFEKRKLRILHVLRAPTGGLFRHVCDLARAQAALGHEIGIIADSMTGGATADEKFENLKPHLALGLRRFAIHRKPHLRDVIGIRQTHNFAKASNAHVIHGHGSKGGIFARVAAASLRKRDVICAYTPHGGSFHRQRGYYLYISIERAMKPLTDAYVFESAYIAQSVSKTVGAPKCCAAIARNGLYPEEFAPTRPGPDAADFVFVGELTHYKGIDVIIDALSRIFHETSFRPKTIIVGDGALRQELEAHVRRKGLEDLIVFVGARPAREAFAMGRTLLVASRAESLPYVVLEAAAAQMPIIATNVGGIPEIFGPCAEGLTPPNNPDAYAVAILKRLETSEDEVRLNAEKLADYIKSNFSVDRMTDAVLDAYSDALARKMRGSAV